MPDSEIRACYTIKKAAHLLCVSPATLQKLASFTGVIPTFKLFGRECITYKQLMMIMNGEVTL